jgi:hypothetical protein
MDLSGLSPSYFKLESSLDELTGITISLRPNKRASRDNAPGPRQRTATAITAQRAAVVGVTRGPVVDAGNHEKIPTMPTPAAAKATNLVRKPIRSEHPTALTSAASATPANPSSCLSPKYATLWVIRTTPVASRKSRRPVPGQPSGNIENIWSSGHLLHTISQNMVSPGDVESLMVGIFFYHY